MPATGTSDPFHLSRFLEAQEGVFAQVRTELAQGQKRSHWMWFIFPQIQGLGSSSMAQRFALSGLDEAAAYLRHPVLGGRLRECAALVNAVEGRSVSQIFGYPDDLKFHSSVTLFDQAWGEDSGSGTENVFAQALAKYFQGTRDEATMKLLRGKGRG